MTSIIEEMERRENLAGKRESEYPKVVDGRRDDSEGLAPESYYGQGDELPLPK